jgi:hypothetical protein
MEGQQVQPLGEAVQGNAGHGRGGWRTAARCAGLIPVLLFLFQGNPDTTQVGRVTVIAPAERTSLGIALAEQADHGHRWPGRLPPDTAPIRLVLLPDSGTMAATFGGRAPGWGVGLAFPNSRTIVLRADQPDPSGTLQHELAHLALHNAVRSRIPLWFDEGYASWAAGEWERIELLHLGVALAGVEPPGLRSLDAMLRGSERTADVAYALATSAVLELARRNPAGTLDALVSELERGTDFDSAVLRTTGLTADRFEVAWQQAVRSRYNLLTWLLAGGFWTLAAGVVILAMYVRRRADRPRRAALDVGWVIPPESDPVDPGEPGR